MFPIQMTFTVSTQAELARLVEATAGIPATPVESVDKPPKTEAKLAASEAKKETLGPKPETAGASAAQPAATPGTSAPTAAASGGDEAPLDYDKDVKPAFLALVQAKGRKAGRKIIDAFNPTKEKLSEAISTQEQFEQALKLIEKEMGDA